MSVINDHVHSCFAAFVPGAIDSLAHPVYQVWSCPAYQKKLELLHGHTAVFWQRSLSLADALDHGQDRQSTANNIPSDESLEQGRNRSRELIFTAEQPR